jgi:hypothetical protein
MTDTPEPRTWEEFTHRLAELVVDCLQRRLGLTDPVISRVFKRTGKAGQGQRPGPRRDH